MTEGDGGEVINLEKARVQLEEGAPIRRKFGRPCAHKHTMVNADQRIVTCEKCGAELDPIAVLDDLAREFWRYQGPLQIVESKLRKAQQKLDDTTREERNARARLKRLQRKL